MSNLRTQVMLDTLYEIVDDLDYYKLLRVDPQCEPADISAAYKAQSQKLHPDKSSTLKDMKDKANYIYTAINEAFRVLKDPDSRLVYDNLLENGQLRVEDTALNTNVDRQNANDPANAATTEMSKKYWTLALSDYESKRFESAILNIKFALQFERENEVFVEWLEKAKVALKKAPKKEANPYKLRL